MIRFRIYCSRYRQRLCNTLAIFGLVVFMAPVCHAQQEQDYAVQANIIYHFTKYINWPDEKKSGAFIIGVVGDSPLFEKLKVFIGSNKMAGGQRIEIRKYQPSDSYFDCHILFIGEDRSNSLKKIAGTTAVSPVLLVTESDGLARKGACINFRIVDERLKLEINKKNIEQHHLNIATELLNLGEVVQ